MGAGHARVGSFENQLSSDISFLQKPDVSLFVLHFGHPEPLAR